MMAKTNPNKAAQELGRKGGQARAKKLSKKRIKEIASLASNKRWNKTKSLNKET
jgi:hypothetical protein